jgi:hypothetical protein
MFGKPRLAEKTSATKSKKCEQFVRCNFVEWLKSDRHGLPAKLFPHAKKVKPNIVLLKFKMTPKAVSKLTISFAIE